MTFWECFTEDREVLASSKVGGKTAQEVLQETAWSIINIAPVNTVPVL